MSKRTEHHRGERVPFLLIKKAFVHLASSVWNADASDLTSSWIIQDFENCSQLKPAAFLLPLNPSQVEKARLQVTGPSHLPTKTRCVFRVRRKILEQIAGASSDAVQRMS